MLFKAQRVSKVSVSKSAQGRRGSVSEEEILEAFSFTLFSDIFFSFLAAQAVCCGARVLPIVTHWFSCPAACRILDPQSGTELSSSALKGGFVTTG